MSGMFKKTSRCPAQYTLKINGIEVEVTEKNVKNFNLRVNRSSGMVKVSCPFQTDKTELARFLESKSGWIRKHLSSFRKYNKASKKNSYTDGEAHYFFGRKVILRVQQNPKRNVSIRQREGISELIISAGRNDNTENLKYVIHEFYRAELKREIPKLIDKWEPVMNVKISDFGVKKMKTRWGTCNIRAKRIWLNLELAKRHPDCLEYVVVHEMVHLLERLHSKRFYRLMDYFLPDWRTRKELLNQPLSC